MRHNNVEPSLLVSQLYASFSPCYRRVRGKDISVTCHVIVLQTAEANAEKEGLLT